ncbi:hypothetical protein [Xanthomonas euvesicatoria]|uniref:hypothetical protein n=1 Tax=Xanthomonas euvesicatoria TaxID=456327 RepID=UPI000F8E2021|nr:hypothetical protein [Xanthomonas euvesicatoria]
MFRSFEEAKSELAEFDIQIDRATEDDEVIIVSGSMDWIGSHYECGIFAFPTFGHFCAEWAWHVARTLEDARRNSLTEAFLLRSNTAQRANILKEMVGFHATGSSVIAEIIEGTKITTENIPSNWKQKLTNALLPPNCGAAFYHGYICEIARQLDPLAVKIHQEELILGSNSLNLAGPSDC